MTILKYTPDEELSIHRESAILQLARHIGSHESGLPEWAKNSSDAYIRNQVPRDQRIIVLIFEFGQKIRPSSISCLDFVGMTSNDIEGYFRIWMDPDAASRGEVVTNLQGGHGHGGKAYMIQVFKDYAYLYSVRNNRGCKYGVPGEEIQFGYIPSPEKGRDFNVSDPKLEFGKALSDVGLTFEKLPKAAIHSFKQSEGFTHVRGVNPKQYSKQIPVPHLLDNIVNHIQMVKTLQLCDVFVVVNGELYNDGKPLILPEITPMVGAEEPKKIPIPEFLNDPVSEKKVSTTNEGQFPTGTLSISTSDKSMRWKPRIFRHNIRFIAHSDFIGKVDITELNILSSYRDRIFGECYLDALEDYKQSDRTRLTESPLTRALNNWIQRQIELYCKVFETREKRIYGQKEKDELNSMNLALNEWKNQFLDEMMEGLWGGEGIGTPEPDREPLQKGIPSRMLLSSSHSRASVGVSLRPTLKFFDNEGIRIRPVPYRWVSSETNVAMVEEDLSLINTFSFGTTQIYAETHDGRLKSNSILLEVVRINEIKIKPEEVEVPAGSRQRFSAICQLASGETISDVYLIWVVDNDSLAKVSSAGLIYGFEPGETKVYAMDEHCVSNPAIISVVPALGRGLGDKKGRGYPLILISDIDPDPVTEEIVSFSRETPPVWQRPIDVERNIWWINSASPLARLFLDSSKGYGYGSSEWRLYLLERYVEIMAKIRLGFDYRQGEDVSFDYWMSRWDEITAQMQEHTVTSLRNFIKIGELPGEY